jgi:hypothetical protein
MIISVGVLITVYLANISSHSDLVSLWHLQLYDVRMSQQLEILDLSLDSASHVATDELLSSYDLERNLLIGDAMNGKLDLPEGALSQRPNDMIGTDALLGLLWGRLNRLPIFILGRTARAGIWSLVLRTTIVAGRERYRELFVVVALVLVRHHGRQLLWCLFDGRRLLKL